VELVGILNDDTNSVSISSLAAYMTVILSVSMKTLSRTYEIIYILITQWKIHSVDLFIYFLIIMLFAVVAWRKAPL